MTNATRGRLWKWANRIGLGLLATTFVAILSGAYTLGSKVTTTQDRIAECEQWEKNKDEKWELHEEIQRNDLEQMHKNIRDDFDALSTKIDNFASANNKSHEDMLKLLIGKVSATGSGDAGMPVVRQ
jgi:hypothetical protein